MKGFIALLMLISLMACSSTANRTVASVGQNCVIEKHHEHDWYRFKMHGKPMTDQWYSLEEATQHMNTYRDGYCQ